jgi:hypothetical protein
VHPSVNHLVYLCAMALDGGESCMAAAVEESTGLSHEGRPSLVDGMISRADGATTLTPAAVATCLYNDCDSDTVAWATARLGPQPMNNLGQTPAAVAWRQRPSTYVVCSDDQAIHPGLQRIFARRCTDTRTWPTGHSPFASQPGLLARLLCVLAS